MFCAVLQFLCLAAVVFAVSVDKPGLEHFEEFVKMDYLDNVPGFYEMSIEEQKQKLLELGEKKGGEELKVKND